MCEPGRLTLRAWLVDRLRDIGEKCDFVFTSMGSDAAVEEVYAELFAGQEGQVDAGDGIK